MTPEELVGPLAEPARLRLLGAVALVDGGHLLRGSGIHAPPSVDPPPKGVGEGSVAGLGLS